MANISSGASGPWSSTSTWTGGVVPGPGDNVTIAGHAVTVDQDVTIADLRYNGAGVIDFSGSTPFNFTSTGTAIYGAATTTPYCIRFSSTYTAVGTTLTFNAVSFGGVQSTSAVGYIGIDSSSSGSATITIASFTGDNNTSGNEPAMIYYAAQGGVSLDVSCSAYTLNLSHFIDANRASSSNPNLSITLNTNNAVITNSTSAYLIYTASSFQADVTINGNFETNTSSGTALNMNVHSSRTLTVNGDVITRNTQGGMVLDGSGAITINGNVEHYSTSSTGVVISGSSTSLVINGDVTSRNNSSGNQTMVTALSIQVRGDITSGTRGAAIQANATNSVVAVGLPYSGQTYTITSSDKGSAVFGHIRYTPGNYYKLVVPSDADFPASTGAAVTLSTFGAGPEPSDVRSGTAYPSGVAGTANVPDPASVRAGVDVNDTVGTALLDLPDLANITGGQIATLSE